MKIMRLLVLCLFNICYSAQLTDLTGILRELTPPPIMPYQYVTDPAFDQGGTIMMNGRPWDFSVTSEITALLRKSGTTLTRGPGLYGFFSGPADINGSLVEIPSSFADRLFVLFIIKSGQQSIPLFLSTVATDDEINQVCTACLSASEKLSLIQKYQKGESLRDSSSSMETSSSSARSIVLPLTTSMSQEDVRTTLSGIRDLGEDPLRSTPEMERTKYFKTCFSLLGISFEPGDLSMLSKGVLSLEFLDRVAKTPEAKNRLVYFLSDLPWINRVYAESYNGDRLPESLEYIKSITEIYCGSSKINVLQLELLRQLPNLRKIVFSSATLLNNVHDGQRAYINSRKYTETIRNLLSLFISSMTYLEVLDLKGTGLEVNFQAHVTELLSQRSTQVQPRRITFS